MRYSFYASTPESTRSRILAAQQLLYRRILVGIPFESALEIGPGLGGFAKYCADRAIRYQAMEQNPTLAEQLCNRGFQVQTGDVNDIKPGIGHFDLVFASHVIEHVGDWRAAWRVLDRLLACLNKNGHLVMLFPDVGLTTPRNHYADYTHTFPTTQRAVRRMLYDLGACCIREGYYIGRWVRGWRLFWIAHRMLPDWLLSTRRAEQLADLFAPHAYCIAKNAIGSPRGSVAASSIALAEAAGTRQLDALALNDKIVSMNSVDRILQLQLDNATSERLSDPSQFSSSL